MTLLKWQLKNNKYIQQLTSSSEKDRTSQYLKSSNAELESIGDIIDDDELWFDIQTIVDHYAYVNDSLVKIQGDNKNSSDVYHQLSKLRTHYREQKDDEAEDSLKVRWELIQDDMHYAALSGDPRMLDVDYKATKEQKAIK